MCMCVLLEKMRMCVSVCVARMRIEAKGRERGRERERPERPSWRQLHEAPVQSPPPSESTAVWPRVPSSSSAGSTRARATYGNTEDGTCAYQREGGREG